MSDVPPSGPLYVTRPDLPSLDEFIPYLREIWRSKILTNGGPFHQKFEEELSKYLGVRYIALFTNATIGLVTALQALRITGEVITTPYSFVATAHSLIWNGIKPVFVDVDPVTFNLDPAKIEAAITPQTTAIMPVHCYGHPCDVDRIQAIADTYGLKVIYDAAHAFGTTIDGRSVTDFGDITMLSFHATKLFQTAEGGALVARDATVKRRIDYLKNFGIQNETSVLMPGINGKMSELQAALGMLTLEMVDGEQQRRKAIGDIYRQRLGPVDGITLPVQSSHFTPSQQYFVIRFDAARCGATRDAMFEGLKKYNVFARRYFFPLCSDYSCYRMLPSAHPSYLPVAQNISSEVLCLPYYGELSGDDAHRICDILLFLMQDGAQS